MDDPLLAGVPARLDGRFLLSQALQKPGDERMSRKAGYFALFAQDPWRTEPVFCFRLYMSCLDAELARYHRDQVRPACFPFQEGHNV
jgi:hypothetical protein